MSVQNVDTSEKFIRDAKRLMKILSEARDVHHFNNSETKFLKIICKICEHRGVRTYKLLQKQNQEQLISLDTHTCILI